MWLNVRTGNLGAIPIIVGEIAVMIFFGFTATNFFTAVNFVNLITQTAGTACSRTASSSCSCSARSTSRSATSPASAR